MSYIVALTGGIGSGKTTVANTFAQLGVPIVDADIIARQIVEPGQPALSAIAERFGPNILRDDGTLNRSALRELIFNNEAQKRWLNQLLHPLIQQETLRQFSSIDAPYLLWVIPLLIENHLTDRADRILVIDVDPQVQLARTMSRDGVNHQLAKNILDAQVSRQVRLSYADDVIDNSGSPDSLPDIVQQLHQRYLQLAADHNNLDA